jgi:hypothetical protein
MVTKTSSSDAPRPVDVMGATLWNPEYREKLNGFRQGHIVENIPVFYLGSATVPLWSTPSTILSTDLGASLYACVEEGPVLRHAMITTQGCDISKPTHPWVSLVPVYDACAHFDDNKLGNVRAGRVEYLLPLLPPWADSEKRYVADLRIELPVEKTVLLERLPLPAYLNEDDYVKVGQRLARLRQRPDVANECLEQVVQPLFDWIRGQDQAIQERMWESVDHVRIWQNNPMTPDTARLFIIVREGAEARHDEELWDEAHAAVYENASAAGIKLVPYKAATLDLMTANEFQTSFHVEDGGSTS